MQQPCIPTAYITEGFPESWTLQSKDSADLYRINESSAQENSVFWYWLRKHTIALVAVMYRYVYLHRWWFILLKCVCAFLIINTWWASIFAYHFLEISYYLIRFSSSGGSFCLGPIVIFSYAIFLKSIHNVCLVLKKRYIIKKKIL